MRIFLKVFIDALPDMKMMERRIHILMKVVYHILSLNHYFPALFLRVIVER